MLSFNHNQLPGPPGTLYYHLLLQIEGKLWLMMTGTPHQGFALKTFATLDQAAYSLDAVTSLVRNKKRGDPLAGNAMLYLVSIWPLIIGFPRGEGELADYVEDPQVMGSHLLETAEPVGLVRMRPSVRRYVVYDVVKNTMPGIEEVGRSGDTIQYRWAEMHFHGSKAN
jgi:hypothetical protein